VDGRSGRDGPGDTRWRAYPDDVAQPKRSAQRRTAAALAEDLGQARKVGGLWRAGQADLATTVDFLSLIGLAPDEDPVARARDLLAAFVRRGCERHRKKHRRDKTARAATASLEILLLRPDSDTRKVQRIRQDAARAASHSISPDAIRHREDRIIGEIAEEVFADLQSRRGDEPQSVEAAIHHLVPIVADLRQQLHDGLCLTYPKVPPASPREQLIIDGFYRQAIVKLGALLVASDHLAGLGLRTPNLTTKEYYFVHKARNIRRNILDDAHDRQFLMEFTRADDSEDWENSVERLLGSERGKEVYGTWLEWVQSCYPTCAFERSAELVYMCRPHELVTLLYEVEIHYVELGFSELNIPGNEPILHHGLGRLSGK
jgi:hypothetical protein